MACLPIKSTLSLASLSANGYLSLSLPVSVFFSVSVSACLSLSVSSFVSLSLSLSLCLSVSLSVSVSVSVSLSLSLCLCLCLCLPVSLSSLIFPMEKLQYSLFYIIINAGKKGKKWWRVDTKEERCCCHCDNICNHTCVS